MTEFPRLARQTAQKSGADMESSFWATDTEKVEVEMLTSDAAEKA